MKKLALDHDTARGADWFTDRYEAIHVSRNRWLMTSVIALGLAAFQALALVCLVPLKTSVPFLIREEPSGIVTTLVPLRGSTSVTASETVRKYFLGRYVSFRETYDPMDVLENYRAVILMSENAEARRFDQFIATSNPESPVVRFGAQTRRIIQIQSIAFLNPNTAQVRYSAREERMAASPHTTQWIATLSFRFGSVPSDEAGRFVNPLGFTVTHYRVDQEVVS